MRFARSSSARRDELTFLPPPMSAWRHILPRHLPPDVARRTGERARWWVRGIGGDGSYPALWCGDACSSRFASGAFGHAPSPLRCAIMDTKPPDVLLLSAEWPERALLRAQLIEEGYEVV